MSDESPRDPPVRTGARRIFALALVSLAAALVSGTAASLLHARWPSFIDGLSFSGVVEFDGPTHVGALAGGSYTVNDRQGRRSLVLSSTGRLLRFFDVRGGESAVLVLGPEPCGGMLVARLRTDGAFTLAREGGSLHGVEFLASRLSPGMVFDLKDGVLGIDERPVEDEPSLVDHSLHDLGDREAGPAGPVRWDVGGYLSFRFRSDGSLVGIREDGVAERRASPDAEPVILASGLDLRHPLYPFFPGGLELAVVDRMSRVIVIPAAGADGVAAPRIVEVEPSDGSLPTLWSSDAWPDGSMAMSDSGNDAIILVSPDGSAVSVRRALPSARVAAIRSAFSVSALLAGISAALALVLGCAGLFIHARRYSVKLVLAFLLLVGASSAASGTVAFLSARSVSVAELRKGLMRANAVAASFLPADRLAGLDAGMPAGGDQEAGAIAAAMSAAMESLPDEGYWGMYLYGRDGGIWAYLDESGSFTPYLRSAPYLEDAVESGAPVYRRYEDPTGEYLSALQAVGGDGPRDWVLETTVDASEVDGASLALGLRTALAAALIALASVLVMVPLSRALSRKLRYLRTGAERVSAGDYSWRIRSRDGDEVGEVSRAFDAMAGRIGTAIARSTALVEANSRFVPARLLEMLGKEGILELALGDQAMRRMTVLFSDIVGFTTMSEGMDPGSTFAFVNGYLSRMGPLVREHGGFVDKYIGDAIMALFPDSPDDAAATALAMIGELETMNRERAADGLPPVATGIGMHSGELMLGIIGEEGRWEGTVLSDAVNLASRLEGLTRLYGVRALASAESAEGFSGAVRSRFIDTVRVKGRRFPTRVLEIVAPGDPAAEVKLGGAEAYRSTFEAYERRDFGAASEAFARMELGGDSAAGTLRARCEAWLASGAPDGFDGAMLIHEK